MKVKSLKQKIINYFKYRRLIKIGLFDSHFYSEMYYDVSRKLNNPLKHFLKSGWRDGYNPSQYFDTKYYLASNLDVKDSGTEPLLHYLDYGWKEGRNPNPYFDVTYYLEHNPEIRESNIEPLSHYISNGWKTGANPSKLFDVNYYLEKNLDVKLAGIEPLFHYLKYGIHENRLFSGSQVLLEDVSDFYMSNKSKCKLNNVVDIVIPVYNGFEFLEPLFTSLFESTTTEHRLIILDDDSSDFRVREFLDQVSKFKNLYCIELISISNPSNLGFVATVNKALNYIKHNFVILNSDTEVPFGWLERLMSPLEKNEKIASTTPFTNSGTICSFPNWQKDNDLPFGLCVNEVDKAFRTINSVTFQNIPTGVGFCMGINKKVVDLIGLFDENTFNKGYCEENDWCMRAKSHGYINIHVTNLFVYHKHGGSFGFDKDELLKENFAKLVSKYPTYKAEIAYYTKMDVLSTLRSSILLRLVLSQIDTVLIIDHDIGGGTQKFVEENLLNISNSVIRLIECKNSREIKILIYDKGCLLADFRFKSLESFIVNVLPNVKFKCVYLNHLISFFDINLCKYIIKHHSYNSVYFFHDYFAVCPSYNLLDYHGNYCGAELNLSKCNACISKNKYIPLKFNFNPDMVLWRQNFSDLLSVTNKIICFSQNGVNIVSKIFPNINAKIVINLHKNIINTPYIINSINYAKQEFLTVGVLGAINYSKGRSILEGLAQKPLFVNRMIRLVLIGYADKTIINNCKITGKYLPDNLTTIIKENKIDLFLIPSIWPETYCYTADEIISMGFPLICYDIGAHAERVKQYSRGFVCESINVDSIYEKIIQVAKQYNFTKIQ